MRVTIRVTRVTSMSGSFLPISRSKFLEKSELVFSSERTVAEHNAKGLQPILNEPSRPW